MPVSKFQQTITDANAPSRLQGLVITAILTEEEPKGRLDFEIDMPDNPTPNELGYFKWYIGELVDRLQAGMGPDSQMKFNPHPMELKKV